MAGDTVRATFYVQFEPEYKNYGSVKGIAAKRMTQRPPRDTVGPVVCFRVDLPVSRFLDFIDLNVPVGDVEVIAMTGADAA